MIRDCNKQDTQDAIIDAAERLLSKYGYTKMTMTDLAEEAGIGVGTIYLYFPGKVDVALAVLDRVNARVRTRLYEIAGKSEPPAQRLKEMLISRILIRYDRVRNQQHPTDEFKTRRPADHQRTARSLAIGRSGNICRCFTGRFSDGRI